MDTDACCGKSEIDFFTPNHVQTVMQHGKWVDDYPTSSVTTMSPIEFNIRGSADDYIDLSNTMFVMRCKITKADGTTALPSDAYATTTNNFMHSLFSDISLTIGDKQVEGGNFMYPYRAYLHNLLTYNTGAKKCLLNAAGWAKDIAGEMYGTQTSTGWAARAKWISSTNEIEFAGPLCLDLLAQDKYLINNVDVKIKMNHSKPEFAFMIKELTMLADLLVLCSM